ncbi:hypothetical protein LOAG_11496 [Loa loa]|uniref:Uncharacterized protein n=1 Tax=Loa loa TaxID=7209 RepID=A0A1S0TMY3_LOALO|nr:hypothetical protein LOAG_11496 [Loa loa]EFO17007.2 hypothetical protein LOAG_11496 [Loa loa]
MDVYEEVDDTQSEIDEAVEEMIDTSNNDSMATQEISRDPTHSTVASLATSQSNNSPTNYPAQYPNPINLTIYPPMNGLNISPVYYTDPQSTGFIADNRNVANYEEVSTYPLPPTRISLFSEIQRTTAPDHTDPQNSPSSVIPSSNYSPNDYVPPPFRAPVLPIPTSDNATNNNPSESITSSQQTIAMTQTTAQSELMQKTKKRGRKRLCDNATRTNEPNIIPENSIPKKRGRKRKDSNDDSGGKTNDALHEIAHQSINDANLTNNEANVKEAQKQNSGISNQSLNAVLAVTNADEDEKKKKSVPVRKSLENLMKQLMTHQIKEDNSVTGKSSTTKKQCMEELLCKQKSRMAFPKGTFLIRYCDLETLDSDQIWCVDNHHMLLKYRLTSHIEGKRRLYLKSQPERFIGWKCEEPWHFYELTVLERDRDGSKVLILYPDAKELAECREKAKRQKQIAEEIKRGLGTSRDSGSVKQDFGETENDQMMQNDDTFMDTEDQRLHQQQNIEVQMVDEAANAIERFILIPDNDYTEMNDEHMEETVAIKDSTEEQMIITEEDNK